MKLRSFFSLLVLTSVLVSGCQNGQTGSSSSHSEIISKEAPYSSANSDTSNNSSTANSQSPLYFVLADPSGVAYMKYNPNNNTGEKVSVDLAASIVESNSEMIYGNSHDADGQAWISRSQDNGQQVEQLVPKAAGFSIVGESLYYTIDVPNSGYQIYKSDLDGKNSQEVPVGLLKQYSNYFIAQDILYYTDAPYGQEEQMDSYHNIIVWDMKKQEAIAQIKVPEARSLAIRGIWDNKIVYSDMLADAAGSGYCDIASGESFSLGTVSPKIMIANDVLYYAGDGAGTDLWSWKAGDEAPQKLIDGNMGHFAFHEEWIYYCSDDSFNDWKRYSIDTGEIQALPDDIVGMPASRSQADSMPMSSYYY